MNDGKITDSINDSYSKIKIDEEEIKDDMNELQKLVEDQEKIKNKIEKQNETLKYDKSKYCRYYYVKFY